MSRIILVRHGHVAGINPPRFRGRADLQLTPQGRQEAEKVAERVAKEWSPYLVYTSPLGRCVETGGEVARACNAPSEILHELNDIDYGRWQGKSYDEVRTINAELLATWLRTPDQAAFPGGESLQDVAARGARAIRFVQERHAAETVVLVSHDSVNRVILTLALNMPLSSYWRLVQEPCCLNEIELDPNGIRVRRINDTSHLAL